MLEDIQQQIDRLQHPHWSARFFDPIINLVLRRLYRRLSSVRIEIGVPSCDLLYDERVIRIVFTIPCSMAEWRVHRVRVLQQYLDAAQGSEEDQLAAQEEYDRQWEGVRTLHRVQGLLL